MRVDPFRSPPLVERTCCMFVDFLGCCKNEAKKKPNPSMRRRFCLPELFFSKASAPKATFKGSSKELDVRTPGQWPFLPCPERKYQITEPPPPTPSHPPTTSFLNFSPSLPLSNTFSLFPRGTRFYFSTVYELFGPLCRRIRCLSSPSNVRIWSALLSPRARNLERFTRGDGKCLYLLECSNACFWVWGGGIIIFLNNYSETPLQ